LLTRTSRLPSLRARADLPVRPRTLAILVLAATGVFVLGLFLRTLADVSATPPGALSPAAVVVSSAVIVLREGLEAILVLAAVVASLFGINDAAAAFIQRGGKVKVIIDISYQIIDVVQELLSIGEEVRHIEKHGVMFVVFDRKQSISAIHIPDSASLNAPMTALWTDDPAYANYLATAWEVLWEHSIPAELRIQELLAQGPAQA